MKSLIGYLKKILFLFSFLILFSFPLKTFASENFQIYSSFQHTVSETKIDTEVVIQIKVEEPRVLSFYNASFPIPKLKPLCSNFKTSEPLDCTYFDKGTSSDILINLQNAVIRPEAPLEIKLSYTTENNSTTAYSFYSYIADTTTNSISIIYPKEKGEPLWTSDPIHNIKASGDNFEITINKPIYPNLSLIFGENVTYRFDINKVFNNTSKDEYQTFELYVPSDTETQIIIWDEIIPQPNITLHDEDGNYVFKYILEPNKTLNCKVTGYIQKISPMETSLKPKSYLIHKSGYWSITNNTEFKRVNKYLQKKGLPIQEDFDNINNLEEGQRELFYKYVYQYVIERLRHEEGVTLGIYAQTRLGANSLTESSDKSSPVDYADFYIALLRKYMVPSRMVVGYVSNITGYSSDGFYHHWVEYFDEKKKVWVTADPFLQSYFDKDLFGSSFHDHIAILRRGKSTVAPKISFFTENDFVLTSETEKIILPSFDINSELTLEKYKVTNKYLKAYVYISNTGNTTVNTYNIFDSNVSYIQKYVDPINNLQSAIILPHQNSTFQINIPSEIINEEKLSLGISFSNLQFQKEDFSLESNIEKITPLYITILAKVVSFLGFFTLLFLIYFLIRKFKQNKNG